MLQTSDMQEAGSLGFENFISPRYYLGLVKRRFLHFLIPVILIAPAGAAIVMWLPAIYVSEGKILVESARIPTELVRPTVTTRASERIQLIEQRLMARDNIMSIVDKFKLFADRRATLSTTEVIDLMRERTRIKAQELSGAGAAQDKVTLTFTVGFEHEHPDTAMQVANEFVTLILSADARNRTSRASETTRFLAREVKRLQTELASLEGQTNEVKRTRAETAGSSHNAALERFQTFVDQTNAQIANLKAERLTKANRLTFSHPEVQAIQRRIATLEKAIAEPPTQASVQREVETGIESLLKQQAGLQTNLNETTAKLAAAQLGEALERDQFAEKLEVLEQPGRPQQPIKPKRLKLLALVLGAAVFAGAGLAVGTEFLDSTVRSRADLTRLVGSHMFVTIPVVVNRRDRLWRRIRVIQAISFLLVLLLGGVAGAYFFLPPPDVLWQQATVQLPRYLNR